MRSRKPREISWVYDTGLAPRCIGTGLLVPQFISLPFIPVIYSKVDWNSTESWLKIDWKSIKKVWEKRRLEDKVSKSYLQKWMQQLVTWPLYYTNMSSRPHLVCNTYCARVTTFENGAKNTAFRFLMLDKYTKIVKIEPFQQASWPRFPGFGQNHIGGFEKIFFQNKGSR